MMLRQRSTKYLLLLMSILLLGGVGILARPFLLQTVQYGVTLDGVAIGGLSRQDVKQMLLLWQNNRSHVERKAYYGDQCFLFLDETLEYDLDMDETLKSVFGPTTQRSLPEKIWQSLKIWHQGYAVSTHFRYNDNRLTELVKLWQEKIDRKPKSAVYHWESQTWGQEEPGCRLDVDAVKQLLLERMPYPNETSLVLPVVSEQPHLTLSQVQKEGFHYPRGRFITYFDKSEFNRAANIQLAAEKINGQILYPGQTFSFNQIVGPRDMEHGFKEALEIVGNELVPGIGGGICQVSSTLYNAVLLANLTVKERYNHSKPLTYIPLGRDATVVYGTLDFQFQNTTDSPVLIVAEVLGNRLTVGVVSSEQAEEIVEIVTEEQKVLAPPIVKKPDRILWLGETQLEKQGKPGYEVKTVRIVRNHSQEIKREVLATDRYLPEPTVMKVGLQLPPFAEPFKVRDP